MPWSTRAAISTSAVGAIPQSREAAANQIVPITKIRRRPKRSPSEPPSRIREASDRRYPLTTHCSWTSEASRSVPMVRSATLTTDPSSSVSPEPRVAAAMMPRPCGVPHTTAAMGTG